MSDTDGFIEEVTEEVRRDQLYGYLRRYGWIAVLAVLLIVGGASWNEYRKAQTQAQAEALGDRLLDAIEIEDSGARSVALSEISTDGASGAVVGLLAATQAADQGETADSIATLEALASNGDLPEIYRQIAGFKALLLTEGAARAEGFAAFATPGNPLRLLAQEQLALIDLERGDRDAALAGMQAILQDAEVSSGLQQRAMQVIVALGGEPETALSSN